MSTKRVMGEMPKVARKRTLAELMIISRSSVSEGTIKLL